MSATEAIIRRAFECYVTKDRAGIDALMRDDLQFTSPYDDHIDKTTYMERCWPNSERMRAVHLAQVFTQGNAGFVRYRFDTVDGKSFWNTEYIVTDGERIRSVDVYFGALPDS